VNPKAKIIVTVSPVPLIATYVDRHVLVSNCYSKAALRSVDPRQNSVTAAGIQSAMRIFCAHYTLNGTAAGTGAQVLKLDVRREVSAAAKVICEEEAIDAR
jgi:hypothetical protein